MNFELSKKKGLSGCNLNLVNDGRLVRKSSSNINYNSRLHLQMEKQKSFSNISIKGIKTPKIINSGYENNIFYFDMEYIFGHQPFDFFISGTKTEINNFIKYLNNYFNFLFSSTHIIEISYFKTENIKKLNSLHNNSEHKDFINYLIDKVNDLESNTFIKSDCHGDFTIANMIYYNNNIYLLDFLDSYINSPIIDLVKLKQDLYHNWSLLNSNYTEQEFYRASQISVFIWNKIYLEYSEYINTKEFKIIEAINFLRIEPYINSDMKLSLNKIIKSLEIYEEFNNTNGW
jgi:hypothetical protein